MNRTSITALVGVAALSTALSSGLPMRALTMDAMAGLASLVGAGRAEAAGAAHGTPSTHAGGVSR